MDFFTLNATDALVNLVCGLMSLSLWFNQRGERCLIYWAAGLVAYAAVAAFYPFAPGNAVRMATGYSLLNVGVVLIWLGFRAFDDDSRLPVWLLMLPLAPLSMCLSVGLIGGDWVMAEYATLAVHCAIAIGQAAYILRYRLGRFGPRAMAGYSVYAIALSTIAAAVVRDLIGDARTADSLIPLCDHAVTIVFTMSVIAMVGERHFLKLVQVARCDPLTGVLNRAGLAEATAQRDGNSALLLFDLDHFKSINDTFGHDGGDAVLCDFTKRASATIGDAALLARLGGEEFVVVSDDLSLEEGARLAETVCSAARQEPVHVGDNHIPFTVSVGVALRHHGEDLYEALRRADEALYRAKTNGRDRVVASSGEEPSFVEAPTSLPASRRRVRG